MPRKKRKEIGVQALRTTVNPPKEVARKNVEKALEEERMGVIEVSHSVAVRFGVLSLITGTLLLAFWAYVTATGETSWVTDTTLLFFVPLALVGIISIIGGLLLMGRGQ